MALLHGAVPRDHAPLEVERDQSLAQALDDAPDELLAYLRLPGERRHREALGVFHLREYPDADGGAHEHHEPDGDIGPLSLADRRPPNREVGGPRCQRHRHSTRHAVVVGLQSRDQQQGEKERALGTAREVDEEQREDDVGAEDPDVQPEHHARPVPQRNDDRDAVEEEAEEGAVNAAPPPVGGGRQGHPYHAGQDGEDPEQRQRQHARAAEPASHLAKANLPAGHGRHYTGHAEHGRVSVALALSRTGAYPATGLGPSRIRISARVGRHGSPMSGRASFFTSLAPTLSLIRSPADAITLPRTRRARGAAVSVSRRVELGRLQFLR